MPYKIRKSGSGYKVTSPGRSYSKSPMSKEKAKKQLAALHMHTNESEIPSMAEVFSVHESPQNLSQQLKTATPVTAAKITQQAQDALKNQRQTLAGAQKTQGTTIKMGKTDPQNPIANVFVTKPDGSADVMDNSTGQLKPVPGIQQSNPSSPMKNTGVVGTK